MVTIRKLFRYLYDSDYRFLIDFLSIPNDLVCIRECLMRYT